MVAAESCKFGAVVTSLALASLSSHRHLPGKRVSSSAALDWDSSLVEVIEQPAVATEFTTPATPDLLVVMGLLGPLQVQSRVGGRWQAAQYHSGTIGLTAPGSSDTLRWHMINSSPRMTLHVHLPSELLETTRADLPRASRIADLDALDLKISSRPPFCGRYTVLCVGRRRPWSPIRWHKPLRRNFFPHRLRVPQRKPTHRVGYRSAR